MTDMTQVNVAVSSTEPDDYVDNYRASAHYEPAPVTPSRLVRNETAQDMQKRMSTKFAQDPSLHAAMAETLEKSIKFESKAKRWQKATLGVAGLAALLLCAMFSVVILGNEISKEIKTGGTHHSLVDKMAPDAIVSVAVAEEDLPLVVAPVLDTEHLDKVKTLSCTFGANYELFIRSAEPELDGPMLIPGQSADPESHPEKFARFSNATTQAGGGDPVGGAKTRMTIKYTVLGYALASDTEMTFFTDGGDKIIVSNGAAWIERPRGHVYYVAFSSAHAASFSVAGVNATEVETKAFQALAAKGITPGSNQLLTYADPSARRQLSPKRQLVVDYGWCSINAGFITGLASDSSNYCDPNQRCDSSGGCGGSLSSCCIVHDKCLQSTSGTSRCGKTNCKGSTCDSHLASCAWGVSCWYKWKCGWWKCSGYDAGCGVASTAVAGAMGGVSPQRGWNTGGANTHTCCDGSC